MAVFRVGVIATERGWRLAGDTDPVEFRSQAAALLAAQRLAHIARWRGAEVTLLTQARPGGELAEMQLLTAAALERVLTAARPDEEGVARRH